MSQRNLTELKNNNEFDLDLDEKEQVSQPQSESFEDEEGLVNSFN